jgi:hypothetical protein
LKRSFLSARAIYCASLLVPGLAFAQTAGMAKDAKTASAPVSASMAMKPAATPSPGVTDPTAAVPPVVYQSVFAGSPKGVEMESSDWKKANAEVGQFKRGHVDILKWEEAQTQIPMQPKPMGSDASKPAMPEAPVPAPAPAPARQSPPPAPSLQAPGMHKH